MTSYLVLKITFIASVIFAAIGAFPLVAFIFLLVWLMAARMMGRNALKGFCVAVTLTISLFLAIPQLIP
jgi:hypothetical protein